MIKIRAAIGQNVCKVSVHTMVFIPLLWVYIHTNATEPTAISQRGRAFLKYIRMENEAYQIKFGCGSQHA